MRQNHAKPAPCRQPLTFYCPYDALRLSFAAVRNPRIRKGFHFTIGWFDWCGVGKGDGDAHATSSQAALMATVASAAPCRSA